MKRFFYSILIPLIFISQAAWGETAESIFAKAYGNLYKNNTGEAIRIFEKGIATYPDCAFLYAGMGDAYLKNGNYDKAINLYATAQKKKYAVDIYKIDFYNANIQKDMSDVQYAINTLIAATKISDNPTLFKNIAYLLNEKYSNLLLIQEDYYNDEDEELKRINALKATGKKEEALKGYLQIFSSKPDNYQAANNAAVTLIDLKDYQLAEKYLLKALDINSNSAVIYNNLAIVKLHQHNYKDAALNIDKALKVKSDYIPAINNRAVAKIQGDLDFYKSANVNALLDIIKKDNENYYAVRTLAKIYAFKGDYKSAYNIISPLVPAHNFKIHTQKAYLAYKSGDLQNALNYINNAISLYSDNAVDYELKGRILTSLGRYYEARENLLKVSQKDKKNCSSYYFNAVNFLKEGDKQAALATLKTYIAIKKGNSQANHLDLLLNSVLY